MKVKEAREILDPGVVSGESLYQRASKLFVEEVEARIKLRSHGRPATQGVIQSVLDEMKDWFGKVADGLPFSEPGTPEDIIKWEEGRVWVRHTLIDPKIEAWGKRTRLEMLRGARFPMWNAMTVESLDAATSMMLAKMQRDLGAVVGEPEKEVTSEND